MICFFDAAAAGGTFRPVRPTSAFLLVALPLTLPLAAQSPRSASTDAALLQRSDYRQAVAALKDGLPEVAVPRLKKLLASGAVKGAAAGPVQLLYAGALIRSGNAVEGLAQASAAEARSLPGAAFWRGAALAKLGRYAEALREVESEPPDSKLAAEAAFTKASLLVVLGQADAAVAALAPVASGSEENAALRAKLWTAEILLSAGRLPDGIAPLLPAAAQAGGRYAGPIRYLKARLALASGDAAGAAAGFASLSEGGRGIPPALQHAAALGRARALQTQGQTSPALSVLEKLIGLNPPPARSVLLAAFDAFEKLNTPPTAEAENFLKAWIKSENEDLRVLARLAAVAAQEAAGRPADALAACQAMGAELAASPLLPWVLLREARLSILTGNREGVASVAARLEPVAASPAVRAWASWLKATAGFNTGQMEAASREFTAAAAGSAGSDARTAAAYNAAIAELRSGITDPQGPLAILDGIGTELARTAGAEFHLERSLYLAAAGRDGARDGLLAFVDALPDHPRRFEALVALAELSIGEAGTRPEDIQRAIAEAAAAAKAPAELESAAWLKVLAAEKTGAPDDFAKEAAAFLTAWPETARRAPLRMRLGEMYFRRQNFAAARQQFVQLATQDPLHPLAEPALFWAGKSALLTLGQTAGDDAIAHWEEVYKRGGPLKLEARLQVALLKQRRNDHAGALQLLDAILAMKPDPEPAIRRQALCARGEILVARNATPEEAAQGLASFDRVAEDVAMPQPWRHEALVRKGVCLEQLKRSDEALDAWYSVLTELPQGGETDDYWYHRAGEKSLRLLESRGRYDEAVTIAEKMARTPGPRGRAAAELVNQLALKYGIWREMEKPGPATTTPTAPTPPAPGGAPP